MALFSDELFNVFEEEPEKTNAKAKKRRRDGNNTSVQSGEPEEPKKAKVDEAKASTHKSSATSLPSGPEAMEDEPFVETDGRET